MTSTILGFLPRIYYAPEGAGAAAPEPAPAEGDQSDDDDFKEEEVVIPAEEGEGGEGDPTAAEAPPAPKKRGPKRYADFTRKIKEATSYAEQVAAENKTLRERVQAAERAATESQDVAMATYEKSAKTQLASAEKEYEEALAGTDTSRITAATKALTSATTAMDDIEAVKRQKPADPPPQQQQPARQQQQPQPQQAPDLPEDVKGFVMEHRWFDAVARDAQGRPLIDRASGQFAGNPDFNPDMHAEAVLYSKKIERQIANGSKKFAVSSPEYFQAVEDHMREEFPDYFDEDDDAAPTQPAPGRRGSPVAGPGNKNLPGAPSKSGGNSYKLTSDEVRFITKQVQNGGGAKYPKGHAKEFKPMSLEDAKVSFARQKIKQAKDSPQ